MVRFYPPIFIKPPEEDKDVIVFGKSPELRDEDLKYGVSRFGGQWRAPSYLGAYLRAAKILVEKGIETNTLDDIGLPAFYMHRHTTELLIKRLLSWLYEIAFFYAQLDRDNHGVPSKKQKERFERKHCLENLFNDLVSASKCFGFTEPPDELKKLVNTIIQYEKTETWARYDKSESGGGVIRHVESECTLPLVDIQGQLELVVLKTLWQGPFRDESYENSLYATWLCLARETGSAG